ncbi:hypothetical protein WJX72_000658 [[Myrmecia] bisecta]|uniref:polynucleotide adenylyltransferase n=1 Tax=[Myrmecia] bisecta TaxID=41462 RepID=A0AAW1PSZ8_9CHLO
MDVVDSGGLLSSLGIASHPPAKANGKHVQENGGRPQTPATGASLGTSLDDDFISFGEEGKPAGAPRDACPPADAVNLDAATRSQEGASTSGRATLPWSVASRRIQSPLLRLHNEVAEFCRFLEPTEAEAAARTAAVQRIREVIQAIWPACSVQLFGSFVTGLYLPTSDLDLVVVDSNCTNIPQALKAIASSLSRKNLATEVQVIAKAKVPIIKFQEVASRLNFDISFDVANGPQAAEYVRAVMHAYLPMKPLVMVLKVFLQQRELNEVYSGGIGSYALLVMVAAFLMTHPSRKADYSGKPGELEASLGVLLVDFARLYGRALNMTDVGVSCRNGGVFFSKRQKFFQGERPYLLAVEDPQDVDNDLCKGSYAIQKVRQAFEFAYMQLTAPADPDESLLQRIIRLDAVLVDRPRLVSWKNLKPLSEAAPQATSAASPHAGKQEAAVANGHGHEHKHKHKQKHKRQRSHENQDGKDPEEHHRHHRHKSRRKGDSKDRERNDRGGSREGGHREDRGSRKHRHRSSSYDGAGGDADRGSKRRRKGERDAAFGDDVQIVGEQAALKQQHIRFQ